MIESPHPRAPRRRGYAARFDDLFGALAQRREVPDETARRTDAQRSTRGSSTRRGSSIRRGSSRQHRPSGGRGSFPRFGQCRTKPYWIKAVAIALWPGVSVGLRIEMTQPPHAGSLWRLAVGHGVLCGPPVDKLAAVFLGARLSQQRCARPGESSGRPRAVLSAHCPGRSVYQPVTASRAAVAITPTPTIPNVRYIRVRSAGIRTARPIPTPRPTRPNPALASACRPAEVKTEA